MRHFLDRSIIAVRKAKSQRRSHERSTRRVSAGTDFRDRIKYLGWVGLEPTTNALKGRCSTIELPTPRRETSSETILKSVGCNLKTSTMGLTTKDVRNDPASSSLFDHRVGVVVVDRFVVFRLDPVPIDPRVFIGHDRNIADQIFDEDRVIVGPFSDRFFVRPL
jgi:hypothetical protein